MSICVAKIYNPNIIKCSQNIINKYLPLMNIAIECVPF